MTSKIFSGFLPSAQMTHSADVPPRQALKRASAFVTVSSVRLAIIQIRKSPLYTVGANAWRLDKIVTVKTPMDELTDQVSSAVVHY